MDEYVRQTYRDLVINARYLAVIGGRKCIIDPLIAIYVCLDISKASNDQFLMDYGVWNE